jgi:glycosyltransferase involved in cell wall biosynthesis
MARFVIKLLHVIDSMNLEGGGPTQGLRNLTAFYEGLGVSATVLCMDETSAKPANAEHLNIVSLGRGKGVFGYHPDLVDWLSENASSFNAVIVHGLWQYHGQAVFKALKTLNVPYYVFPHGMLDPWFKDQYPLKHLKKYVYWFLAQYPVLKNAKAVLFTCEEEKLLARESFTPYQVREKVVNYGTTLTEVAKQSTADDFLNALPALKGKRIVLFLSRIQEKKGCDLLIRAFARVAAVDDDLQLVMAGPDQTGLQAELEQLAESLGVASRITWTGMLKNEQKWGALKTAEVFVLPSHQENFGIAVAEALAVGTPVLISNKVNIWREIEAMGAGLVAEDTEAGTLKNLRTWLAMDESERANMRSQTTVCYSQKFDIAQAAKNLITLIKADLAHG